MRSRSSGFTVLLALAVAVVLSLALAPGADAARRTCTGFKCINNDHLRDEPGLIVCPDGNCTEEVGPGD
jgi:hypothetical protein